MTQTEIFMVAGLAGLAVTITLVDLVLSFVRHRRSARVRVFSTRIQRSVQDEAAAAARSEWIRRRLSAIQSASHDVPTPPVVSD